MAARLIFTGHSDDLAEFDYEGDVEVIDDDENGIHCDEFAVHEEKSPGWRVELTGHPGGVFFVRATFHPSGAWHITIEPDTPDFEEQTGFPEAVNARYSMDDYKQVCVIDLDGGAVVSRWIIE